MTLNNGLQRAEGYVVDVAHDTSFIFRFLPLSAVARLSVVLSPLTILFVNTTRAAIPLQHRHPFAAPSTLLSLLTEQPRARIDWSVGRVGEVGEKGRERQTERKARVRGCETRYREEQEVEILFATDGLYC